MRIYSRRKSRELPERKADSVRTHMADYEYKVTKAPCAETETIVHWNYMVYKVTPTKVLLSHSEDSPSRDHAERNARQLIVLYMELDRMEVMRDFTAA
jgi:DUF1680 family protein